jgi:hypothetical protein
VQHRVSAVFLVTGHRAAGLEARVMDRGHEIAREEGPHRLTDEIGRGDTRDAEPVCDVGGDGGFARAGGAADEQDQRQVELVEIAVAAQALHRACTVLAPELLQRDLLEPLDRGRRAASRGEVGLDRDRELVGAVGGEARGDQGARHQALRERQPVLAAERQGLAVAAVTHCEQAP